MVVVRPLRQRGEIGGLRARQLVHRLVEIEQRRRGHAIGADAEIDFVEIEFEDLLLGEGPLDLHREKGFLELARKRQLIRQEEVLRHLLGDGRGALRTPSAAVVLYIGYERARDAGEVDPVMLVEVFVFGRYEGVEDELGHGLDRNIQAPFLGIFREQRTVRRMDSRHDRRLIILKLRIVRQVLGVMPQ